MIRASRFAITVATALSAAISGLPAYSSRLELAAQQTQAGRAGRASVDSADLADQDSMAFRGTQGQPGPQAQGGNAAGGSSWVRILGFVLLAFALISAAVVALRMMLSRFRKSERYDLPLVVFPLKNQDRSAGDHVPLQPNPGLSPARPQQVQPHRTTPAPLPANRAAPGPPPALRSAPPAEFVNVPRQDEGTLQLLPGRFEIASGNDRMKEIRFVKVPGPAVVTFGRFASATPTHIQVDSPTVSRLHASMRYAAGRWHIKNLSATNPVMVNGQQLSADGIEQLLNDGDQVEMGDVIFRFRSR
jgi:hypothetical protein